MQFMNKVFAPGCALMLYKPHLAEKLNSFLNDEFEGIKMLTTCCKHEPKLEVKTEVINICPGCDKRFKNDYPITTTISLWEILAESKSFPFPDYGGKIMSINDACPTREVSVIQDAVRIILKRMNIIVVEPEKTRNKGVCCGDTFYGALPVENVKELMKKRASEMPVEDVAVYCISCTKSMFIGGKKPHYLIDLLFGEETIPKTTDPDEWHKELDDYIAAH